MHINIHVGLNSGLEVTHIPFMQHVHVCTIPIPYFIPMNDSLSSDPGYLYSFKIIVELVIDIFCEKTAQIWENQSQIVYRIVKTFNENCKAADFVNGITLGCMETITRASFSHTNNHFLSYFICDCRLTNIFNTLLTSLSMNGRYSCIQHYITDE